MSTNYFKKKQYLSPLFIISFGQHLGLIIPRVLSNRIKTVKKLDQRSFTDYSRTMTISCWSSKASWRLSSLGWCSWFMTPISFLTVFLSSGYGVLMNLATKLRPVDFSTARCTTPKAPLHVQSQPAHSFQNFVNALIFVECSKSFYANVIQFLCRLRTEK